MPTSHKVKQRRRAAIDLEQRRRYYQHRPASPVRCLFSHLAWVAGHRRLYKTSNPLFDMAFCHETIGWARECNRRIKATPPAPTP